MHLIEILLPLNDNSGRPFAAEKYAAVRQHLTERFGGLTAFTRSPAQGTTKGRGKTVHDEIVVFEVMTEALDFGWWRNYRLPLEQDFRRDEIVVRASINHHVALTEDRHEGHRPAFPRSREVALSTPISAALRGLPKPGEKRSPWRSRRCG
jgi:hypothetical protein